MTVAATALARATALGLPTAALEDWRYVKCDAFAAPLDQPRRPSVEDLRAHVTAEHRAFVVVDGKFHSLGHGDWPAPWKPAFPSPAQDAAWVESLAVETDIAAAWALAGECRQVISVLGSHPEPLHVVNVATGGASGWTLRIEVAAGAELDLVLRHIALGAARSAPRLELVLGRGANVRISEVQVTPWTHLLPTARLTLAADAKATWVTAGTGGGLVRQRWEATLAGKGADVGYQAATVVRGSHQIHHLTRVVHAAGHTTSSQDLRAVLHEQSRRSFDGVVSMPPGVDGSSAEQQDRNIVLSPAARADTRPQLDIRADEVKAAHGATIGRMDAEEVLYLRMRGLDLDQARGLLIGAFTAAVVDAMPDATARDLAQHLWNTAP